MRIGFLVSSLGATQLAYHILHQANVHLKQRIDLDVLVFYQNIVKSWTTPVFGVMNISEAYDFNGVAVATDLDTAELLQHFPGPKARYFYAWDLEWLRDNGRSYEQMAKVYCDMRIPILARSQRHSQVIEECWNRPVRSVVSNCDIPSLVGVLKEDGQR